MTEVTVRRAVIGLAVRQVRWGTLVVVGVAAGMSALVVASFHALVVDRDDLAALTELANNPAVRTLFGPPVALDDPGGFAVWRTGTPLAVLVAAWAMVTATRVTRGEESAGRWGLLLAGRMTLASTVARHTTVLAAGAALTGAAATAALTATGTAAGGAVLFGCGIALVGVFFAGVGAVCAQVFAARAAATGAGTAVLGVTLLARMVGDGVAHLSGLRWATPFGLLAASRPFSDDNWLPVVVLAAVAAAVVRGAVMLARQRDVGDGVLAVPVVRASRPWLLGSVGGFAVRTGIGVTVGWSLAIGIYFLVIGGLAGSITGFLAAHPQIADLAAQAGFTHFDRFDGYVAALCALLAVPVGLFTVVRTAALASEEAAGRLTLLLASPVGRARVLLVNAAVTLGGAVVLATVAAVATWLGTGTHLGLGAALAGTCNMLPLAVLSLGAANFALGAAPRVVALVGAVPTAGGFLLWTLATAVGAPAWVAELSPFSHLAPVPVTAPDWPASAAMLALSAGLTAAGAFAYRRRDVRG
jgi:ABC-2 type transport system permease protein